MKHSFLCGISRRTISTGLASKFNYIHVDPKYSFQSKRTGLFGIEELKEPGGFNILKNEALSHATNLVDQIVKTKPNHNAVSLFDDLSNSLCKVADLAEFVRVAHPQPRFRDQAENASVAISNLVEQLNTDRRLYDSLKPLDFKDDLDNYVARLFMFDFEQSGIHLDDDNRCRLLQLNESIIRLGSQFSANANQVRQIDTRKLPAKVRHLFEKNTNRAVLASLYADSSDEHVREIAYRLNLQYDEQQDRILTNLLLCRQRLAQMCGFPSYAHRAVKGGIAGSPEVVKDFLNILSDQIKPLANQDYNQLLQMKRERSSSNMRGANSNSNILNAWDVPYYSATYKRSIYNERIIQCLPYFSIGVCMDGLNTIFQRLYGIRMQVEDCKNGELWHNDVIKLSIIDEEENELLGHIYCDLFERPMKVHQDCHHTIRGGCQLADGSYQKPIVVLVLSLASSNDNNPALLAPSMVDNLFHEMGHAMHSMMAQTKYQHITGTRCSTDLAEVPSILMEFFASDSRVVKQFARHYKTGKQMPDELIKCWIKSKKMFIASETQLQLFYAALDQSYHSENVFANNESTTDILARIQNQFYSIAYVPETAWQLRFSHLVGYGAKYYSYLVSRSIATAIWKKLFARDPLNRSAGLQYKNEVLRHGGGKPAEEIASSVLERDISAEFMASSIISSFREPELK